MSFDQSTRNCLARFVGEARSLLTEEFTRQLQHEYGMDPFSGEITGIEKLTALNDAQRETAKVLRETLEYYLAGKPANIKNQHEILERILREQAFTVLNRLCALRMAEARGIIQESVAHGYHSKGFLLYSRLAGNALGETGDAYLSYLFSIFDELAVELPPLFDRFSPQGRLFPRETKLLELLDLLNNPEIDTLWAEDETIGWIYQYFNSKEERQAMRAASQAPRNSRELAVRNQFFTPRYVVEFLTDNTLGRIWYEMTQGTTSLKEICRYLVRRPEEVFLSETVTGLAEHAQDLSLKAAQWLLNGNEETFPPFDTSHTSRQRLIQLASVVDGYRRYPKPDVWEDWQLVAIHRDIQDQEDLSTHPLQELLDIMFFLARWDHFSEILENSRELSLMARIGNEVCKRVLAGQREELNQEELLKAPVFIPYRPLKDPREIKMLDPACGSMHFGLYAFDLFEQIYSEAWELEEKLGQEKIWRLADLEPLHKSYLDKNAFLRAVPRLIIERNIHGIDIDPRAVQIAGLSLWLRAQKSWQAQNVKVQERPQIRKSNIVCAEPMPGDRAMLEEFLSTLQEDQLEVLMHQVAHIPAGQNVRVTKAMVGALKKLVRTVWQEMELAGEAGSLLKIEETLSDAIAIARKESEENAPLFRVLEYGLNEISREQYLQDIPGEKQDFWNWAEELLICALKLYAEYIEYQDSYRKSLFIKDSTRGFAFIDMCRIKYDVVLMNPPFGEASEKSRSYFEVHYPLWNKNLLCAFCEKGIDWVDQKGRVGAIIDKTALIKSTYATFREDILSIYHANHYLIDFGWGVLDANVETGGLILSRDIYSSHTLLKVSNFEVDNRSYELEKLIQKIILGDSSKGGYLLYPETLKLFPNGSIPFDIDDWLIPVISRCRKFEKVIGRALAGNSLKADINFRLFWEIPDNGEIGKGKYWSTLYNGGEFSRYISIIRDVTRYGLNGDAVPPHISTRWCNMRDQQKPGIGWGKRGDYVDSHIMPSGSVFTVEGQGLPISDSNLRWITLGFMNSPLFSFLMNLFCGQHKYAGYVNVCPVPEVNDIHAARMGKLTEKIIIKIHDIFTEDETAREFQGLPLNNITSFNTYANNLSTKRKEILEQILELDELISRECFDWYKVGEEGQKAVQEFWQKSPSIRTIIYPWNDIDSLKRTIMANIVSYIVGIAFNRWDVSIAKGSYSPSNDSELFDELPWPQSAKLGVTQENMQFNIFTSDEGSQEDLFNNIRRAIDEIWPTKASSIELEIASLLNVVSLRVYLEDISQFFKDHLQKYSHNRRYAPIYWPLSTPSCSYTLWLYYHRLTDQTLYTCVNDFVDPKLRQVTGEVSRLRQNKYRSTGDEKELEHLIDFEQELKDFRSELLRIAAFWKPNLNDGVQITAASLWRLFQYKPWQKTLKETWEKLEAGEYDWAHLAYSIWPDRVREKCKTDKSLAIAHDLEYLYVEPKKTNKKKIGQKKQLAREDMDELFEES